MGDYRYPGGAEDVRNREVLGSGSTMGDVASYFLRDKRRGASSGGRKDEGGKWDDWEDSIRRWAIGEGRPYRMGSGRWGEQEYELASLMGMPFRGDPREFLAQAMGKGVDEVTHEDMLELLYNARAKGLMREGR